MLLLDRNKIPSNTVLYLAAVIHGLLETNDGLDYSELLKKLSEKMLGKQINITFYSLALNFLFLLNKVYIDKRGAVHVYKQSESHQY